MAAEVTCLAIFSSLKPAQNERTPPWPPPRAVRPTRRKYSVASRGQSNRTTHDTGCLAKSMPRERRSVQMRIFFLKKSLALTLSELNSSEIFLYASLPLRPWRTRTFQRLCPVRLSLGSIFLRLFSMRRQLSMVLQKTTTRLSSILRRTPCCRCHASANAFSLTTAGWRSSLGFWRRLFGVQSTMTCSHDGATLCKPGPKCQDMGLLTRVRTFPSLVRVGTTIMDSKSFNR
mmetsp:Transcript_45352/g.96906  ORF Transcript_45352/g.96906 Transcript_45352/m.96906 type:complete len:231 (-) Transcript_45352:464-1156(-)